MTMVYEYDRQKICRVCSDRAMGFNFNAISCESCKAFFRRNAYKTEKLRCPFNNDCIIDVSSRRFCQKCRLDKCLRVGMKREWILSDEQRKIKRAKIEENRQRRHGQWYQYNNKLDQQLNHHYHPIEPPSPSLSSSSQFGDESINQINCNTTVPSYSFISSLPSSNEAAMTNDYRDSNYDMKALTNESIAMKNIDNQLIDRSTTNCLERDLLVNLDNDWINLIKDNGNDNGSGNDRDISDLGSHANSTSSINGDGDKLSSHGHGFETIDLGEKEKAWRLKVNHRILEANFTPLYLRNDKYGNGKPLNELETAKIAELVAAFSVIDEPLLDQSCVENADLADIIKFSDLAIRRLIRWCKKIQAFTSLCLEDQIALLKAGCLEMLSMKASFNFNLDAESWQDIHTNNGLKLNIFRKTSEKLYKAHREFIRTFKQRWRTDHKVNLLLVAIVLFNPERPHLLHPNTIRLEHYTYIYLLRRYLEAKCDTLCQARADHYHLMMKIEDLRELHENTIKLYADVGSAAVGPLLIEILDLK